MGDPHSKKDRANAYPFSANGDIHVTPAPKSAPAPALSRPAEKQKHLYCIYLRSVSVFQDREDRGSARSNDTFCSTFPRPRADQLHVATSRQHKFRVRQRPIGDPNSGNFHQGPSWRFPSPPGWPVFLPHRRRGYGSAPPRVSCRQIVTVETLKRWIHQGALDNGRFMP